MVDIKFEFDGISDHYGADEQMARDIAAHMLDGSVLPVSVTDALEAGLLAMCLDEARRTKSVIEMGEIWAQFDASLAGQLS